MQMNLRHAANRTSRSVTTLRRYIRSGRLHAEKRKGRYGPEYSVSEAALAEAGLHTLPAEETEQPPKEKALTTVSDALGRVLRDSVPLVLHQELQMKHEQLLVQYGMVRVTGLRVLELQAELEARQQTLEESQASSARLKQQLARETSRLGQRLREAELELEGKRLEIAALKEKIRGLEMLTRNVVTNEAIERQFSEVMEQARKVEQMTSEPETEPPTSPGWPSAPRGDETDH